MSDRLVEEARLTDEDVAAGLKLWHSPHGTVWKTETYEEALEAERDALAEEVGRLREALEEYDRWASSMPDAGFTVKSPRWDWWHLRRHPAAKARAALAQDTVER